MKKSRRTLALAILLCGLCRPSIAISVMSLYTSLDDLSARADVCDRPKLKPLHDAYFDIIKTRLRPLGPKEIAKVFGPKLGPDTNAASARGLSYPRTL